MGDAGVNAGLRNKPINTTWRAMANVGAQLAHKHPLRNMRSTETHCGLQSRYLDVLETVLKVISNWAINNATSPAKLHRYTGDDLIILTGTASALSGNFYHNPSYLRWTKATNGAVTNPSATKQGIYKATNSREAE